MSTQTLKAKYTHGTLELLDKVNIPEGEEVTVHLETSFQVDDETRAWFDADLLGNLPPYEWGEEGVPKGKPVRYEPGRGFTIIE